MASFISPLSVLHTANGLSVTVVDLQVGVALPRVLPWAFDASVMNGS
jgi:hypothetical protein